MKTKFFVNLLLVTFLAFTVISCERDRTARTSADFDIWVTEQEGAYDTLTAEQWEERRTQYQDWTTDLDQRRGTWTEEEQRRYDAARLRFDDLDRRYAERDRNGMETANVTQMEQTLLGQQMDTHYSAVNETNVVQMYERFMTNLRDQQNNFTQSQWDAAEQVFENLNARKNEVDDNLDPSQQAQITSWQMEFRTLASTGRIGAEDDRERVEGQQQPQY